MLSTTLFLTNCSNKPSSLIPEKEPNPITLSTSISGDSEKNVKFQEVILFIGNPGVGKSSLCNSIFQKNVFESGATIANRMTRESQGHVYENGKYIDTPGLSTVADIEQTAAEIEKVLKENNNGRIIFVALLEAGKIRPGDLKNINAICQAIKVDFGYGLIFNKVNKQDMEKINPSWINLLPLHKKPSATVLLEKDDYMEDMYNVFLPKDSESRYKVLNLINILREKRESTKQITRRIEAKEIPTTNLAHQIEQLRIGIDSYYAKHATKKNVDWDNLRLPPSFYTYPKRKQAEFAAKYYKDLLYEKGTKYGGWVLLSRTCYKLNKFERLLPPEQMGFSRIEPKDFKDINYDKQLIRYLRDGLLTITSLTARSINPFVATMTIQNDSNKPITFVVPKGQVIETGRFAKVQNLTITGIVTSNDENIDTSWKIEPDYEVDQEFTIPANSTRTITFNCRCIDPRLASPSGQDYTPTAYKADRALGEAPTVTGTLPQLGEDDLGEIYD